MRHKYGHIWQYYVSHPLHKEVSLPSPVRYVMSTSAGASGGIKRGGNPVRVSANGCPYEQDNEDTLVDVLGLLSSEFGVVPLGLARSYAATSCEEVARASAHNKAGLTGSLMAPTVHTRNTVTSEWHCCYDRNATII